jgi:hypothetical protein
MGLSIIMLTFAPPSISVRRRICPLRKISEVCAPPGSRSSRRLGVSEKVRSSNYLLNA